MNWICAKCGEKHGTRIPELTTWHNGRCDYCKQKREVTEPRDFGIKEKVTPEEFDNFLKNLMN
jgi:DNA-directed RNA polymerase subunit RPC12/RpoP